jgi:hypothetical protein
MEPASGGLALSISFFFSFNFSGFQPVLSKLKVPCYFTYVLNFIFDFFIVIYLLYFFFQLYFSIFDFI